MAKVQSTLQATKLSVFKNTLIISVAVHVLASAYRSITSLQSSLNNEDSLGTGGLAVVNSVLMSSCLIFPSFIMDSLGYKSTLMMSMSLITLYMTANLHAVDYLIYPASIIAGFGASLLWSTVSCYLTKVALIYAQVDGRSNEAALSKIFGIYMLFSQSSFIGGSIISSTVFKRTESNFSARFNSYCGSKFCPDANENNTYLKRPDITKVYITIGSYVALCVLGLMILSLFLDNTASTRSTHARSFNIPKRLFINFFVHVWESKYQKLIIPLTMYRGVENSFFLADYTKSYVACSSGLWTIGYSVICYSSISGLSSLISGLLVKYIRQMHVFILGTVCHVVLQIALLIWIPTVQTFYLLLILAGVWGVGDGIFNTQIHSLYGELFSDKSEAAYSNFLFWESLGKAIAFAYSDLLCTDIKLYICMSNLILGMSGYGYLLYICGKSIESPSKMSTDKDESNSCLENSSKF